jgi:hypothetical protein
MDRNPRNQQFAKQFAIDRTQPREGRIIRRIRNAFRCHPDRIWTVAELATEWAYPLSKPSQFWEYQNTWRVARMLGKQISPAGHRALFRGKKG